MEASYDYTLLVPLARMCDLELLRLPFNEDGSGNGLHCFESQGEGPKSNADRFMFLVDRELAYVREVVVEDATITNYATEYGGALLQVVAALGERNRG